MVVACRAERVATRAAAGVRDTTMTGGVHDSLALTLGVPGSVPAGKPVPLVLRVENRGRRPLDLYLRGRAPTFDVEITRAGGETVWRRLEHEIIPAIVQLRTLAPGERLQLEAVWDQRTGAGQPAAPGEYVARGLLLAEGTPLPTPPTPFRIVAR